MFLRAVIAALRGGEGIIRVTGQKRGWRGDRIKSSLPAITCELIGDALCHSIKQRGGSTLTFATARGNALNGSRSGPAVRCGS